LLGIALLDSPSAMVFTLRDVGALGLALALALAFEKDAIRYRQ
jgi:hypothetical protein